jgi:signal transduction histidine kinase
VCAFPQCRNALGGDKLLPMTNLKLGESGIGSVEEKHTVLVIDDYPAAREAVTFALKDEFRCLCADSARGGLDILKRDSVDAVVLDIRMPEVDGIETLRRIREWGIQTQVILLTGHGSLETARKAVKYGAFDYLAKPFDVDNLRKVVREAVHKNVLDSKEGRNLERKRFADAVAVKIVEAGGTARTGELSSEALREMRNPLTAILGYAQLLLKRIGDRRWRRLSGKSLRYLGIIEEEATKCVEIATRLVMLSEAGKSRQGAVLNETMQNVAALLRPQCSIQEVDIAVTPAAERVVLDIPAEDLYGVLVNLMLNSAEAIREPGDIHLRGYRFSGDDPVLEEPTPSEREFVARSGRRTLAAIEVMDTGRGIEPEHLPKIFDPLVTTKIGESGAGFGLPYCKQKVERSEGHICVVRSRPGETIVRVLLPLLSDL